MYIYTVDAHPVHPFRPPARFHNPPNADNALYPWDTFYHPLPSPFHSTPLFYSSAVFLVSLPSSSRPWLSSHSSNSCPTALHPPPRLPSAPNSFAHFRSCARESRLLACSLARPLVLPECGNGVFRHDVHEFACSAAAHRREIEILVLPGALDCPCMCTLTCASERGRESARFSGCGVRVDKLD